MHVRALMVLMCCLVLACSKSEKKTVSTCETAPIAELISQHPVYVLCGAADVVAGASVVCDSTFEESWQTFEPRDLADRTPSAKVNAGIERLCALIDKLPSATRTEAPAGIASWIDACLAIQQAEDKSQGIEYFASAVFLVPEVKVAIPDDVVRRAPDQVVGDTMASAEFTEMNYALAHTLSRMSQPNRTRVLDEVVTRAAELMKRDE